MPNGFFRKEDQLAIENTLYEVKKEELVARRFLKVNDSYPEYALEIGYDWFDHAGSAKILAAGASAKDIPFVGEKGGRETRKVYTIATGIRYTKAERAAAAAKAALGKGPSVNLDTTRVKGARRFVAETENRIVFTGDKTHNIKGLLNHPGINIADVAQGTTGSTAAAKMLWANKTPQEILDDILAAKTKLEKGNVFKAKVLLLDSDHYNRLLKPYSAMNPMTVLKWLQTEGAYFEDIIVTSQMSAALNSLSVGAFALIDNDPEVMELALTYDLTLGAPVFDILETSEQAVTEGTGGLTLRHPSGVYIAKGI